MPPKKFNVDIVANFLNSRTLREKQMIIVFGLVFVFFLDWFVLVQRFSAIFAEVSPKIALLKEELKSLNEDQKNKALITKKWEDAKAALGEKEKMFIAPDETPALLEDLSKLAQQSGVKITSLEPYERKSGSSKALYMPLPLLMKASAGTHEFGAFLARLENGKTFFNVTDLRIAANPLNERKHAIELSMEAYKKDK